ncbi:MAG TPA: polysaccharide deacetylase family protein [Candidatus Acidoferrum sp.]|nr:polysaccharide deacetylase family protein [Candidatus Acidoferrum sp.]
MRLDTQLNSVATSNQTVCGDEPSSVSSKWSRRRIAASALYHTGSLGVADRLAWTHDLKRRAGAAFPRLRSATGSKFGILCYHRVGTDGIPLFSRLTPRMFEAQMYHVRKHFRVVSLGQLCREMQEGLPVKPSVAVTFDDGYRDLYTHAFPVLQKYQIPATIYLIGQCMETGEVPWYDRIFLALKVAPAPFLELEMESPRRYGLSSPAARAAAAWGIVSYLRSIPNARRLAWCAAFERRIPLPQRELDGRMLDWQQVRTMSREGILFGAHTMSHPVLSQMETPALEAELVSSKQLLEQGLDSLVEDFAYPFGKPDDCSPDAEKLLKHGGYKSAVTTSSGLNTTGANVFRLLRYQIDEEDSLPSFAFDLSRMFLEGAADANFPAGVNSRGDVVETQAKTEAQAERIGS